MKNKTNLIINILAAVLLLVIIIVLIKFYRLGLFSSQDKLKEYLLGYGAWAPLIFIAIQTMQVIAAPIPGNVTALAGGVIFGTGLGFILSASGLIIGSVLAYYLAKIYGRAIVEKFVKPKDIEKYDKLLATDRGTFILFGLFLLPFFPDDVLCFLAGLAKINIYRFLIMVVLGRIPGMYIASVLGNAAMEGIDIKTIVICVIYFAVIIIAYIFRKK